jgi:hypothetical protein
MEAANFSFNFKTARLLSAIASNLFRSNLVCFTVTASGY